MDFEFFAGDLSLDFINTLAPEPGSASLRDALASYRDLIDWAAQAGLLDPAQREARLALEQQEPRTAAALFRAAIRLRDCLYRLFLAHLDRRPPAAGDLDRCNGFLGEAQAQVRLRWTPEGYQFQPAEDPRPRALLRPIVSSASQLLASGDARHVRQCAAETCRGFFIDRSRNHSRRWCDMKVCGNRAKARQHYSQQKKSG